MSAGQSIYIRKALSLQDLEAAWRLTHDLFVAEGYADPRPDGMLRHYPHLDFAPETTVLVAEDLYGRIVGTCSLTVDGPAGLNMDDDFKDIVDGIRMECRREGKKLGAGWRLATAADAHNSLDVALKLISAMIEELAAQELGVILFVFNPRHERFYQKTIGLRTISAQVRGARSVKGAPAVLMRGDRDEILARWEQVKARRVSARLTPVRVAS